MPPSAFSLSHICHVYINCHFHQLFVLGNHHKHALIQSKIITNMLTQSSTHTRIAYTYSLSLSLLLLSHTYAYSYLPRRGFRLRHALFHTHTDHTHAQAHMHTHIQHLPRLCNRNGHTLTHKHNTDAAYTHTDADSDTHIQTQIVTLTFITCHSSGIIKSYHLSHTHKRRRRRTHNLHTHTLITCHGSGIILSIHSLSHTHRRRRKSELPTHKYITCHGSGIIISIHSGSDRSDPWYKNSSTLSYEPESDCDLSMTGSI